jgi:hypothetical protein
MHQKPKNMLNSTPGAQQIKKPMMNSMPGAPKVDQHDELDA